MTLQLQMLGTGGAFSKKYYNNNALLLTENYTLLIDCGNTALLALHELGRSPESIDAIFISHIHGDHVGGLEEFAFYMNLIHQRKPVLYIAEDLVTPLWENTLKGAMGNGDELSINDYFEVRALQTEVTNQITEGLTLKLIQTPHMPGKSSYSLLINDHIFYSSDMTFQPNLLYKLVYEERITQIFHEVQLNGVGRVHTSLQELLSLPADIQKMISLMHYEDNMGVFVGRVGEMRFLEQQKRYTL
jgi:glyoxylase-like metal-dependent hydrolase (beta-lactamase superfamily II)